MSDQADGLRRLVRERSGNVVNAVATATRPTVAPPSTAHALLLTSGKGGVGTSNLALNLAIALGELGERVVLVDADLGLANIDLLCGLTPSHDLGDVLCGDAPLSAALVEGPGGITLVPGAHGIRTLIDLLQDAPARLAAEFAGLERGADFLIIDAGSGLGPAVATLAAAADEVVVVTTPEPTSVADAHAAIGRLRKLRAVRLRAVVNQARSAAEAHDVLDRLAAGSRQFLGVSVVPLGHVRFDASVPPSVRSRTPFLVGAPNAPAARGVRRIARDLLFEREHDPARARGKQRRHGFFAALAARWAPRRPHERT